MEDKRAEDFIKSYKKSIKYIKVNINGEQVSLPITYSMNAAIKYRDGYEEGTDYRLAFCIMVLEIINQNKKFVDENNKILNLDIDDISGIDDNDLKKIGEEIISGSKDLKEIEVDYADTDDFFEKFYLINAREDEIYKGTVDKISRYIKPIDIIPSSIKMLNQVEGIRNQLDWINRNDNALRHTLGIVPNIHFYNQTIETLQQNKKFLLGNNQKLLNSIGHIDLRRDLVSSTFIKNQHILGQLASQVQSWKEVYNPAIIKSIQNIAIQESAINKILHNPLKEFESIVKGITTITASEKIVEFASLQEEIMRTFKPYIIDLQSIRLEKLAVKEDLKKRAETLRRFGWWYISDISEGIIDQIKEEAEYLNENEVNEIICDFFKKDNFYKLNMMLDTWSEIPFLRRKYVLLEEAIYAHKNEKYASAIQNLITNGEGIIRDFVRETCDLACKSWRPIYKKFKNMVEELEEFLYKYIINFIDYLYLNFDPEYPEKTDDFNRHKIMHGESISHGTEENSLKTILYINEIYHIIKVLMERSKSELIG